MRRSFFHIPTINAVLGTAGQFTLPIRVFHGAVLVTIALCLCTAVINTVVQLPAFAIAIAFASAVLFAGIYVGSRVYRIHAPLVWAGSVWLPLFVGSVWVMNGGSGGATHAFLIILPMFFLPFANVRQRIALTALYCTFSAGLLTIEYARPDVIQGYTSSASRYFDMLFATLATQVAIVIIVSFLLNEHRKLTKQLEHLKEKSESRFGEVADTIPAMIIELNADLIIEFANRACQDFTGFSSTQIGLRVGLPQMVHPDDWPQVKARLAGVSAGKELLAEECRIVTRTGTSKTVLMRAVARHRDGLPNGVLLYMVDITEKKLLEQQYLKAQKMESLGMLAGGIAHDFNNLLTGIMGNANLIRMANTTASGEPRDADLNEHVEPIITGSRRAADLVRRLLIFARQQPIQKTSVDLRELIDEAKDLLVRTIDKKIEINVSSCSDPLIVEGDRSLLVSSIINLCINARDAMPQGGTLALGCRRVATVDHGVARMPQKFPAAGFAQVTVADTGVGMSPEVRQHLFEPFFTTKAPGKGTGLGLASVHGAIQDHGGHVSVTSEVGAGTTFRIYLPLSDCAASPESQPRNAARAAAGERILVVDDEASIGALVKEILTGAGHQVTVISDPTKAMAVTKEAAEPFALVLVDMIMPHMNGVEVIKELRAIDPRLRFLLISGYGGSGDTQAIMRDASIGQLPKPFDPDSLLEAVGELIASREPVQDQHVSRES